MSALLSAAVSEVAGPAERRAQALFVVPSAHSVPVTFGFWRGSAASLLMHALVLAVPLLLNLLGSGHPAVRPRAIEATLIVALPAAPAAEAPAEPPPVLEHTVREPRASDRPQHRPSPKPAPPVPAEHLAPTPATSTPAKAEAREVQPDSDDTRALLDGIRSRWLAPRSAPLFFHCRIQIEYGAGAMIRSVEMQDCGSAELNASIERAVWKSQPLPLAAARGASGTLMLDFTPR